MISNIHLLSNLLKMTFNQLSRLFLNNVPRLNHIQSSICSDLFKNCKNYKFLLRSVVNPNRDYDKQMRQTKSWRQRFPTFCPIDYKTYYDFIHNDQWLSNVSKMDPISYLSYYKTKNHPKSHSCPVCDNMWNNIMKHHQSQLAFRTKISHFIDNNTDEDMMQVMIINYFMFLDMCSLQKNKNMLVVPTLQEDFVWHSHLLDHDNYVRDTNSIFGYVLNHSIDERLVDKSRNSSKELRDMYFNRIFEIFQDKSKEIVNSFEYVIETNKKISRIFDNNYTRTSIRRADNTHNNFMIDNLGTIGTIGALSSISSIDSISSLSMIGSLQNPNIDNIKIKQQSDSSACGSCTSGLSFSSSSGSSSYGSSSSSCGSGSGSDSSSSSGSSSCGSSSCGSSCGGSCGGGCGGGGCGG